MNFNLEQKLTTLFFMLGLAAGIISNYVSNIFITIGIGAAIYVVTFAVLANKVKSKKLKWLIANTLGTFILVWLVVWIFIFNLR